jgi:transitional endoplasmic reticulum ATPase
MGSLPPHDKESMPEHERTQPDLIEPFDHLLLARDARTLWVMRIAVRLCRHDTLWGSHSQHLRRQLLDFLRLQDVPVGNDAERVLCAMRLSLTLDAMEQQASSYRHDSVLADNLDLLTQHLALSPVDSQVLALAVWLRADELMCDLAGETTAFVNLPRQLSLVLNESEATLSDCVKSSGLLRRSGLVEFSSGDSLAGNVRLKRGNLRRLAMTAVRSLDELFDGLMHEAPASQLHADDYAHIGDTLETLYHLLGEAFDSRRSGVNVLLYGPPGTGKTELSRWIANRLNVPLYDVSADEMDGSSGAGDSADARLAKVATCLHLLQGRKAVLAMDECDTVFSGGGAFRGSSADAVKAWVNDLLETNSVPMFWIANNIRSMNSAFVRRFDLVIRLDTPPLRQRQRLLERSCAHLLSPSEIRRFAQSESATPGVMARAINVVERVQAHGGDQPPAALLESILDGTLRAQQHPTIRLANRTAAAQSYDPQLCNASVDLHALSEGLRGAGQGRVLLYGPPGTGKTAFGYWIASILGKPLAVKRMSDIQSPWLGVMEENLADAFESAMRNGAVLQFDEVDGFLRDRRLSTQSWEAPQVNEFLTQLECFDGIFIATTNLIDGLDPAAMRRFDYKIHVGYLRPEQAVTLLQRKLTEWGVPVPDGIACHQRVAGLSRLTPGDFAVVERRHKLLPYGDAMAVIDALGEELVLKAAGQKRIGFM